MAPPEDPFIVRFYSAENPSPDAHGRTFTRILSWSDDRLESNHDYIQVIFPLPEKSMVNWNAPIIDKQVFLAFRDDDGLREGLRRALVRIGAFYGFDVQFSETGAKGGKKEVTITKSAEWERRARNWVMRSNHNHLRITRIIRCLRVLGLRKEAHAFYEAVADVYEESRRIGDTSMEFWTRAVEWPLSRAPDGTVTAWLREFEEQEEREWLEELGEEGSDGEVDGQKAER